MAENVHHKAILLAAEKLAIAVNEYFEDDCLLTKTRLREALHTFEWIQFTDKEIKQLRELAEECEKHHRPIFWGADHIMPNVILRLLNRLERSEEREQNG